MFGEKAGEGEVAAVDEDVGGGEGEGVRVGWLGGLGGG